MTKWGAVIGKRFRHLYQEIRGEIPLFEYLSWWVMRVILFAGGIWSIFHRPDETFEMFVSVALSFLIPLFHLLFMNLWPGKFPIRMQTVGTIYLVITSLCGSLLDFYYIFPWWDMVLHTFGGAILVYVGYCVMVALNAKHRSRFGDPAPIVQATWGVGFSAFVSLVWEIMEFCFDSVSRGDSQHWRVNPDPGFELFKTVTDPQRIDFFHVDAGRYALLDTMTDIMCGITGAIIGFIVVLLWLHRQERAGRLKHGSCAPQKPPREESVPPEEDSRPGEPADHPAEPESSDHEVRNCPADSVS